MIKKTRDRIQAEQQIFHLLLNINELFPQYSITQHLLHVLRKKEDLKEPYYWSEDVLLKKVEDYYDELHNDLITLKMEENA